MFEVWTLPFRDENDFNKLGPLTITGCGQSRFRILRVVVVCDPEPSGIARAVSFESSPLLPNTATGGPGSRPLPGPGGAVRLLIRRSGLLNVWAILGNARREPWEIWHSWQRGICNLLTPGSPEGFESHPHRQIYWNQFINVTFPGVSPQAIVGYLIENTTYGSVGAM